MGVPRSSAGWWKTSDLGKVLFSRVLFKSMNNDMAYHFHASLVVEVVRGDDFPNVGPDFDRHVVHPVLFPLRVDPRHLLLPQDRRHATRREPVEN